MKYLYTFLLFTTCYLVGNTQYLRAFAEEDGTIRVLPVDGTVELTPTTKSGTTPQLEGFPKGYLANPNFKNFRNVTLADLDGDGADEIITGIDNQLYAISATGVLWKHTIIGHATFPPSVADVDGDGDLEIALVAWGVNPTKGNLYLVDHTGNDVAGWPIDFGANVLVNAPTLSDVDDDGQMEILVGERRNSLGVVHLFDNTGGLWSTDWPVMLDATPAVTPSVGDVDGDGEKEIVIFSTRSEYVLRLDGSVADGWPINLVDKKHSYQSPILVDLNADEKLDIVGAAHGDAPEFFVRDYTGDYLPNWPKAVPDASWTFNTPSILQSNEQNTILMSKPGGAAEKDMLYAWSGAGELSEHFPIRKSGGLEGIISIVDIDGDGEPELLFGTNLFYLATNTSAIHAYKMDGSGELPEFPIRPRGWTFMNGATLGDVNGDDKLEIVVLSYTQNFGAATDSVYINAYPTNIPNEAGRVLWGTYKGSNTRDGVVNAPLASPSRTWHNTAKLTLAPNPTHTKTYLDISLDSAKELQVDIVNLLGQVLRTIAVPKAQEQQVEIATDDLESGLYFILVRAGEKTLGVERLLIE